MLGTLIGLGIMHTPPEIPDNYSKFDLNTRIYLKGIIRSHGKTAPHLFNKKADITPLQLLDAMWDLSNFKIAVNLFIHKYTS